MKKTFLTGSLIGLFVMLFLAAVVSAIPTFSDVGIDNSNPKVNENVLFSAKWNSNATLDNYIFSWNNAGSWVNDSTVNFGSISWTNVTKTVTALHKPTLSWIIYARDSDNTWNNTGIQTFTVANTVPTISSGTITVDSHEDSDTATVSASDADSDSLTYSVVSGNASLVTCSIPTSGTTLTATRVGDETGKTTCTVTVNDGTATASADFTINVNRKSMLEISDLDVYVDGEKDANIQKDYEEGYEIGEKASPESTVKFDFVIKSLFDDGDEDEKDIEIEDIVITVTIKNIDDDGDDDLDEETRRDFDLDADEESSTKSIEFDIPMDVEEGTYDVKIVVEGEDDSEYSQEHKIEWTLTLEVEKEDEDVRLKRAEFDQTTLSCDRETTFYVKLVNFGNDDPDEIILTIQNTELDINIKEEDIEIEEGDDWSRSFTITVPDDVLPGTYKVETKMYYDQSAYYDDEDFDWDNWYGSTNLIIKKCVVTTPVEEEEEVPEDEGEVIIVEPTESEEGEEVPTATGGEITREVSFQDTSLYLVLLVATVVILGLILLVMFFKLLSK